MIDTVAVNWTAVEPILPELLLIGYWCAADRL